MSRWREVARPLISAVLANAKAGGWDEKQLRRALRDAYPFGERSYWPYKVWCDEVRAQRGLKKTPVHRGRARPSLIGHSERRIYEEMMGRAP